MVLALIVAARWSLVVAQPDEWLLLVRDGKLAAGGVGIRAWRWPGDVVARFSSTIQRVAFEVEAQTREHLGLKLEGFALWSVGKSPGQALSAFSGLGLVNSEREPGAAATKHLLAKPQYRAFQAYLCAELQQFVTQLSLREALSIREQQAAPVIARITAFMTSVGLELGELEIIAARPSAAQVSESLAAPEREEWVSIGEGGPAGQLLALTELFRGFSARLKTPAESVAAGAGGPHRAGPAVEHHVAVVLQHQARVRPAGSPRGPQRLTGRAVEHQVAIALHHQGAGGAAARTGRPERHSALVEHHVSVTLVDE